MLGNCPREYWYTRYRSWNGWWYKSESPPPRSEAAYVAKFAENVPSWIGSLIHQQAAWALKNASWTSKLDVSALRRKLVDGAVTKIDNGLRQARTQRSGNPKRRIQLVEVENDIEFNEQELRAQVVRLLESLTRSSWDDGPNLFLRALSVPDRIVSVEEMESFEVDGTSVHLAIDLLMRAKVDGDKNVVIVDWKTGRRRTGTAGHQATTYAAWAQHVGWQSVSPIFVYLDKNGGGASVEIGQDVTPKFALEQIRENVSMFLEDLSPRLIDGDLNRNEAIEEMFEPTTNTRLCDFCRFQKLCSRDGTKP